MEPRANELRQSSFAIAHLGAPSLLDVSLSLTAGWHERNAIVQPIPLLWQISARNGMFSVCIRFVFV
jgi:hypothetical protein